MNRFTGAFLVALLVHGLAIYALSQVRTDSPEVNVKQGRASMRMAFQAASAAPAPTETEQQEIKEIKESKEITGSGEPSENSEEKKQSPEPEEKREKESSSEGVTNEPEPSETDESSKTSENKEKQDKSKQKEIEESKEKQDKSKQSEIEESTEKERENEEQAPESVSTEGVEWVESVDYRENPAPRYPTKARVHGIEGTVRLLVTIDAQGNPESVEIHEESGSYRLDEAARQAVRDWTFAPAKDDGEPVRSKTIVPVTFSLEGR